MAEERSPEELERSELLFQKLAAEEPPLDKLDDTAPSRTAPRSAVRDETRKRGRVWIIGVLGVLLLITVGVTLFVFGSAENDPEPDNPGQVEAAITEEAPIDQVTATTRPTTQAPTSIPLTPTSAVATATMLPTAASDEVAVALQAPVTAPGAANVSLQANPFTIIGSVGRTEPITYTVQQGDTVNSIAERFGLDVCTIVWSNVWNRISPPVPGAVLDIIPVDGVFYLLEKNMMIEEVAAATGVEPSAIIEFAANDLMDDTPQTVLLEGMKVVVPGGSKDECSVWSPSTAAGEGTPGGGGGGIDWGCNYTLGNSGFPGLNPLQSSYRFFQGFSGVHSGVDLSAATGTPVYAAGAGTIAFSGTHPYGYGTAVLIDHGNGVFSLYGHLSATNVSCGQNVNQGDMIGAVGSTGRSSGPHLHFEIRMGGFTPVDPLSYVSM